MSFFSEYIHLENSTNLLHQLIHCSMYLQPYVISQILVSKDNSLYLSFIIYYFIHLNILISVVFKDRHFNNLL